MIYECKVCGAHGIGNDLADALERHADQSPNCPLTIRPGVVTDGVYTRMLPREELAA